MTGPARARRVALAASAALLALSCGDFPVANQLDPRFPMQLTLTGPDTTYSNGQVVAYTVATTPSWTGAAPVWHSSQPDHLVPLGDGHFRVASTTYQGTSVTVTATLGPRQVQKTVQVRQRVAQLHVVGAQGTSIDSIALYALREDFGLGVRLQDSSGAPVVLPDGMQVQLASRDTEIARVLQYGGQSGDHNGDTWIVAAFDGLRDSVLVHVQQLPVTIDCSPASPIHLALDDSVQLAVAAWRDAGHFVVQAPPTLTRWSLAWGDSGVTVTPAGMVHVGSTTTQGMASPHWTTPDGAFSGQADGCMIYGG